MTVFIDNQQSTYLYLHKITSKGTSLVSTDAAGLFLYPYFYRRPLVAASVFRPILKIYDGYFLRQ